MSFWTYHQRSFSLPAKRAGVLWLLFALWAGVPANAQQLMEDPAITQPRRGQIEQQATPPTQPTQQATLRGGVVEKRSLNMLQALVSETDVDWYGWYLDTRRYVQQMGGVRCAVGTPIVFSKAGFVTTPSLDADCQVSVTLMYRKLPSGTGLDQLVLPAIPSNRPARSREELIQLLKASAYYK